MALNKRKEQNQNQSNSISTSNLPKGKQKAMKANLRRLHALTFLPYTNQTEEYISSAHF